MWPLDARRFPPQLGSSSHLLSFSTTFQDAPLDMKLTSANFVPHSHLASELQHSNWVTIRSQIMNRAICESANPSTPWIPKLSKGSTVYNLDWMAWSCECRDLRILEHSEDWWFHRGKNLGEGGVSKHSTINNTCWGELLQSMEKTAETPPVQGFFMLHICYEVAPPELVTDYCCMVRNAHTFTFHISFSYISNKLSDVLFTFAWNVRKTEFAQIFHGKKQNSTVSKRNKIRNASKLVPLAAEEGRVDPGWHGIQAERDSGSDVCTLLVFCRWCVSSLTKANLRHSVWALWGLEKTVTCARHPLSCQEQDNLQTWRQPCRHQ